MTTVTTLVISSSGMSPSNVDFLDINILIILKECCNDLVSLLVKDSERILNIARGHIA